MTSSILIHNSFLFLQKGNTFWSLNDPRLELFDLTQCRSPLSAESSGSTTCESSSSPSSSTGFAPAAGEGHDDDVVDEQIVTMIILIIMMLVFDRICSGWG